MTIIGKAAAIVIIVAVKMRFQCLAGIKTIQRAFNIQLTVHRMILASTAKETVLIRRLNSSGRAFTVTARFLNPLFKGECVAYAQVNFQISGSSLSISSGSSFSNISTSSDSISSSISTNSSDTPSESPAKVFCS